MSSQRVYLVGGDAKENYSNWSYTRKQYQKIDIKPHLGVEEYKYMIQFMKINDEFIFGTLEFGTHASFYLKVDTRDYLYDPSGDFVPNGMSVHERIDIIDLDYSGSLEEYYNYHAGYLEGSISIDILKTKLTKEEAELLENNFNSGNFPNYGSINCAQHVGNVISSLERFGRKFNYDSVTLPGTLFDDLESLAIEWEKSTINLTIRKKKQK